MKITKKIELLFYGNKKIPNRKWKWWLKYFFDSIGKETIEKVVVYQHLSVQSLIERGLPPQMKVYNLAFRDGIAGTDGFSDQKTSNNGDMEIVYPQLQILFFILGKLSLS